MSKDSINKTTLYEERKRNEVPRRKKLTGFSPVGKANRGKTQILTFAHLCWILGRCHRSVLCLRTQRFILDSGMQHVSLPRAYYKKYVPDFVVVPTFCVGDAMTRKRLTVCNHPLASYLPAKIDIFFYEIRGMSDDVCPSGNCGPKRK